MKHWSRIIQKWPVDKVRPETVSFQHLMKKRLDKYQNPGKAAESAKIQGNEANVQPVNLTWNEAKEMKQANALYSLLENRYQHSTPLPERLRFPASSVNHYDQIVAESERAPSRGFITKMQDKVKGMFRLK